MYATYTTEVLVSSKADSVGIHATYTTEVLESSEADTI